MTTERTRLVNSLYSDPSSRVNVNRNSVMKYEQFRNNANTNFYNITSHLHDDDVSTIMCLTFYNGGRVNWVDL